MGDGDSDNEVTEHLAFEYLIATGQTASCHISNGKYLIQTFNKNQFGDVIVQTFEAAENADGTFSVDDLTLPSLAAETIV